MDKIIWKDIVGYEGLYAITTDGKVWSYKNNIFLKQNKSAKSGYYKVQLFNNGKANSYFIHRLVAEAYIENPNNFPCVNHKDENKLNNNVDNLEWCTYKYNNSYGTRINRLKNAKRSVEIREKISESLKQYYSTNNVRNNGSVSEETRNKLREAHNKPVLCIETGIIYPSIKIAGETMNIASNHISSCCKGKLKTAGKYHWKYA